MTARAQAPTIRASRWWTRLCAGSCQRPRRMPHGSLVCPECAEIPPERRVVRRAYRLCALPNLRAVRLAQGVSQERLARWSGLSVQTIGNIEAGRHTARPRTAEALAAVLCVSVEDLAGASPK